VDQKDSYFLKNLDLIAADDTAMGPTRFSVKLSQQNSGIHNNTECTLFPITPTHTVYFVDA